MLVSKICGIKDIETLKYIILHECPPKFVGMILNYEKSPRLISIEKAKELTNIKTKIAFKQKQNLNVLKNK